MAFVASSRDIQGSPRSAGNGRPRTREPGRKHRRADQLQRSAERSPASFGRDGRRGEKSVTLKAAGAAPKRRQFKCGIGG